MKLSEIGAIRLECGEIIVLGKHGELLIEIVAGDRFTLFDQLSCYYYDEGWDFEEVTIRFYEDHVENCSGEHVDPTIISLPSLASIDPEVFANLLGLPLWDEEASP